MKEIKKIIKDIISNTSGVIDRLDGDLKHDGFKIIIKSENENPDDIHHEEVWDEDLDIKVWRYNDNDDYPDVLYPCKYAIEVNGDKIKNYKDGKDLFFMMGKKYKAKKKELKKQKVSRILEKLDTFYTKK